GGNQSPNGGDWTFDDYEQLKTTSSMAVAAAARDFRSLRLDDGRSMSVSGRPVSGNYFSVIGIGASLGRTLSPADDTPGAAPVIVVSHGFWKNVLAGDPSFVGKTVWLDDRAYTVVGVTARGFLGNEGRGDTPPSFWTTLADHRTSSLEHAEAVAAARRAQLDALAHKSVLSPDEAQTVTTLRAQLSTTDTSWNLPVQVLVRLSSGITPTQAASELSAQAAAMAAEFGKTVGPNAVLLSSLSANTGVVIVLVVVVGSIVLLAAANVTNVLLASAAGRSKEIGTRLAIGAGRWQVVRQLMMESLLLGAVSAALGFAAAFWGAPVLAHLVQLPPTFDVAPDLRVGAFVAAVTVVMCVCAGLAPARYIRHGDLVSALKTDRLGSPGTIRPGRLRTTLIAMQAAASIALLVVAALFTRSAVHATTMDLGIDADHLLSVSVNLPSSYDEARAEAYWTTAMDRLRGFGSVQSAALINPQLFQGSVASQFNGHYVHRLFTSTSYFETADTRIVRGRTYTDADARADAPVAIISESLARAYWGGADPIGERLTRVWGDDDAPGAPRVSLTVKPAGTVVIGVVADAVMNLKNHEALAIYQPLPTKLIRAAQMIVRTSGDPRSAIAPMRNLMRSLDADPGISIQERPVSDNIAEQLGEPQGIGVLTSLIASIALGLAVVGLFGVTAFVVRQREHEVGVRMTLGAQSRDILRLLLHDGLRPVVIGLVAGLVLAFIAGRLVQRALYGVSGHDPIAIIAAVVVLLAAAVAAIFIPARRAAKIDPARMLREQ
ncbi:MAG TPA: FtsX-like permease family protein, partial [Vicinamibacterales bacterium]|nr:FtsX-like permease family protein [Vicinamibacterales bacterium]